MMFWRAGVAAVLGVVLFQAGAAPRAWADLPPGFPDLDAYTGVDGSPYRVSISFLGAGGDQFSAPAGYRCRMVEIAKSAPSAEVYCWGKLPGTPENEVYASNMHAAEYSTKDPAELDKYDEYSANAPAHYVDKTFTAGDYKALPVGSKIQQRYAGACVVDAQRTACVTDEGLGGSQHGFVLSPDGNLLF